MRHFAVVLFLASVALAQPDAPSAIQNPQPEWKCRSVDASSSRCFNSQFEKPEKPKVFDREFKLWTAVSAVALVADVESTMRAKSKCHPGQCRELNPLYGRNPTRGRMYAINVPMWGAGILVGHWLKKECPANGCGWWRFPLMAFTASHTVGAVHNFVRF
jgi:hypothetical protein